MIPFLRGRATGEQCWYILFHSEYILMTTIVGCVPVFFVLILYSAILYRALKKVGELKKATSDPKGSETAGKLRFFRGSTANIMHEDKDYYYYYYLFISLLVKKNNSLTFWRMIELKLNIWDSVLSH